jgi:hypothetical protein
VIEMAGMVEHCDFTTLTTIYTDDGRLRPDVLVRLPGGKLVVIDAKVPLEAFLAAQDADDDEQHRQHDVWHSLRRTGLEAHVSRTNERSGSSGGRRSSMASRSRAARSGVTPPARRPRGCRVPGWGGLSGREPGPDGASEPLSGHLVLPSFCVS